jgi:hypothetical protein
MMKNIIDFAKRHILWFAVGAVSLLIFRPGLAEVRTMLLIAAIESLAIALSGLALFAYTKVDFTRDVANTNPGFIFLGVHLSVGLIVLGVYLAQYGV